MIVFLHNSRGTWNDVRLGLAPLTEGACVCHNRSLLACWSWCWIAMIVFPSRRAPLTEAFMRSSTRPLRPSTQVADRDTERPDLYRRRLLLLSFRWGRQFLCQGCVSGIWKTAIRYQNTRIPLFGHSTVSTARTEFCPRRCGSAYLLPMLKITWRPPALRT